MGALTNFLELELLDHINRVGSYAMPSNLYACLFTADPGEAGSFTAEVSGGSYARVNVGTGVFAAASGGQITNSAGAITFAVATASWGTITHIGFADASSGGNLLWYAPLAVSKTIASTDQLVFAASAVVLSLD